MSKTTHADLVFNILAYVTETLAEGDIDAALDLGFRVDQVEHLQHLTLQDPHHLSTVRGHLSGARRPSPTRRTRSFTCPAPKAGDAWRTASRRSARRRGPSILTSRRRWIACSPPGASGARPDDSLLFLGNWHDAMPRLIFQDPVLVVPIGVALYQWLQVRCRVYEPTTERFRITRGILSKHIDELELYRVKDVSLHRPFVQRLFSLGTVILDTSDHSTLQIVIPAAADINWLRDQIRRHVEARRDRKGVKEVDFA